MDCSDLAPYDKSSAIPLTLVVWKSGESKEQRVFNHIRLFPDDSISILLLKIKQALALDDVPYAWFENEKPVLYDVITSWSGYNPNPFRANPDSFDIEKHKPELHFRTKQVISTMMYRFVDHGKGRTPRTRPISVVLPEHFPSRLQKNPHYSVDKFKVATPLANQETLLQQWWNLPSSMTNPQKCIAHYVEYTGKIEGPLIWNDLFETFHTDAEVPFIQWIHDAYRILYKIYDQHQIEPSLIDQWTSYNRVAYKQRSAKSSACIFYGNLQYGNTSFYSQAFITEKGDIEIIYKLPVNENVPFSMVRDHCKRFIVSISNMLKKKVKVGMTNVSITTTIPQSIPNYDYFVNAVYNAIPIFHVDKSDDKGMEIVYKRASNYHSHVDIPQYIRSQLARGILEEEIVQTLLDAGVSQKDIRAYIEEANTFEEEPETKGKRDKMGRTLKLKTTMKVARSFVGVDVFIANAPSINEARNGLHWLQCMIVDAKENPLVARPKSRSSPSSSQTTERESSPSSAASVDSNVAGPSQPPSQTKKAFAALAEWTVTPSSSSSSGGGPRLIQLQKADKNLFGATLTNKKNFANSCQPIEAHPIVVTRDHFEKKIKPSRLQYLNNYIEYGSDKTNKNVYLCPVRWCPISEIPIGENEKCPQAGEEPDVHTKGRLNIGFLNNIRTMDNRCVPCCYARPLKAELATECNKHLKEDEPSSSKTKTKKAPTVDKSQPSKPAAPPAKSSTPAAPPAKSSTPAAPPAVAPPVDTYILTRPAPIDNERYGSIPQAVHERVFGTEYAVCTSANYTQQNECLLRRGIRHYNDSLMNAICFLMGFTTKSQLINKLRKDLTPMQYLTLENGRIAAAFIPDEPIQYGRYQSKTEQWLSSDKEYTRLFDVRANMERQVLLYLSCKNYLKYLASDEPKSPQHMMSLMKQLGYLLILWEKEPSDAVSITCPYYQTVEELYLNIAQHDKFVMLLKDGIYYEPLELKRRTTKGVTTIPRSRMTEILKLLKSCKPKDDNMPNLLETLHTVKSWWKTISHGPEKGAHVFDRLILSPDLRIRYILTKSNILITLPKDGLPLTTLPTVIDKLDIQKVYYHEDIVGRQFKNSFAYDGVSMLLGRLANEGITDINISSVPFDHPLQGTYWEGSITIPPINKLPLIIQPMYNPLYDSMIEQDRKWFTLQMYVAKRLWLNYDTLVQPILGLSRKEQLDQLFAKLDFANQVEDGSQQRALRKQLRIVIEETPYQTGKQELWKYLRNLGTKTRFPFFDIIPIHDKKNHEWIFSQLAVEEKLPNAILQPPIGPRANARFMPTETSLEETQMQLAELGSLDTLPSALLSAENATSGNLPTKWTTSSSDNNWQYFSVFEWKNYTQNTIPTLLKWVAHQLKTRVNMDDIKKLRNVVVQRVLTHAQEDPVADANTSLLIKIFSDPSLLRAWSLRSTKTYTTSEKLWENLLRDLPVKSRLEKWSVVANENLYFSNVDMLHAAGLLDCTMFVILHRAINRDESDIIENLPADTTRGSMVDRMKSSMMFAPEYNWDYVKAKPILFFYGQPIELENKTKLCMAYHPMVYKKTTIIFTRLDNAPADIQQMVKAHIQYIHKPFQQ